MRAFVFPGQGTQFVGMGVELARAFPEAQQLLELADRVLGLPLSRIMAEGPAERLMETEITQPAVLVYSLALLRLLQASGLQADVTAGYSLGEYAALVAAGVLDEAEAIALVRDRAQAMIDAYPKNPRSMAVVLGPEREEVDTWIRGCPEGESLCVAGYCTPSLHSLSGTPAGLSWLQEHVRAAGSSAQIKSVPVTLPFHSPLLAAAQPVLEQRLARTELRAARCPIIPNASATLEREPLRIRQLLVEQVVEPVRWVETVAVLRELGVTEVWEIGPGKSLSTYLRKIDRTMKRVNVEDPASLQAVLAECGLAGAAPVPAVELPPPA